MNNLSTGDCICIVFLFAAAVMIAHEIIKWFIGVNEISEKMDEIIKLLKEGKSHD